MDREIERYLEYQRSQRARRVETLGTAVTALLLSTIDLGVTPLKEPENEPTSHTPEHIDSTEGIPVAAMRQRQLGRFAAESAELGYPTAA